MSKKTTKRFSIDCAQPVEDRVIDLERFELYLQSRIKVNGRTGELGDSIKVSHDRSKIYIVADIDFSKRYLKYLTKKYLKAQRLRDYLRVTATSPTAYSLKYFAVNEEAEEEEEA